MFFQQPVPNLGVFQRVFHLQFKKCGSGTCVAIEIDDRQYLVTAYHVVEGIVDFDEIMLWRGGGLVPIPIRTVGCDVDNDIAVLATEAPLCEPDGLQVGAKGLVTGQEVFFLGFPFGMRIEQSLHNPMSFPMPFVKRAVVSGLVLKGGGEDFILDGINNIGFSGGPVCFATRSDCTPDAFTGQVLTRFRLAAIVSAYSETDVPLHAADGREQQFYTPTNTGLIKTTNIDHAVRMIRENPIGPIFDDD